jgi:predicted NUDIX family NTP pyrophosphohydrolase
VKISAGLLLYRQGQSGPQVFLVHPGGAYWAGKDQGAWSLPKGLIAPGEDELACARREFREETGFDADGNGVERDLGVFGNRAASACTSGQSRAISIPPS